jgi:uncharacterized membrane protein YfcA
MHIFNIIFIFKSIFVTMAVIFSSILINDLKKTGVKKERSNVLITATIGAIAYFFDTLGIGSYAISTALLRYFKQINYKNLPGTLNVTAVLPVLLEAFIFISIIEVDYLTIICMVSATCIGSWIGAYIVHKMSEQHICLSISIALFIAASVLLLKQFNIVPVDYVGVIGLTGKNLITATVFSAFIGVLLAMGIGSYAPFLALTLTLGLNVRATFPIMMSATALGSCFASIKFIHIGNYDRKASVSMAIAGLLGVILAAYVVKTLPLQILTWVAIGVIYYTAVNLFMNRLALLNK